MLFSTPDDVIAQSRTLPSSPKAMQQLLPVLDDPNSGSETLVKLLKCERSLAAKVIQVANSPFAGAGTTCGSIEEAVQRLGYREVHRLAMRMLTMELHGRSLRTYGLDCKALWNASIAVAVCARRLAQLLDEDADRAYTLGLLHNVGMAGIDALVRHRAPEARFRPAKWPDLWRTAEVSLLGFDQADAGAAMLRHWGFPPLLVDAMRAQFRPRSGGAGQRLAAILLLSRWASHRLLSGEVALPTREASSLEALGLDGIELEPAIEEMRQALDMNWRQLGLGDVDWNTGKPTALNGS